MAAGPPVIGSPSGTAVEFLVQGPEEWVNCVISCQGDELSFGWGAGHASAEGCYSTQVNQRKHSRKL